MKKSFKQGLFSLILCGVFLLGGCGIGDFTNTDDDIFPDFPLADDKSESWEQWDKDEGTIEIDWFVNYSTFVWSGAQNSLVSNKILEKTGVKINFITPVSDDGQMLNTLISGNKLPDVITLNRNSSERILLAEQGQIYSINGLSQRWAPRLINRIDQEIIDYYAASNGKLYGLPNQYTTESDLQEYEDMGGQLLSNGAVVVREDYLNDYIAYKKSINPSWQDKEASSPQGFIAMCEWVKKNKSITNSQPTVLLSAFDRNIDYNSRAIQHLVEYFNVAPEDNQGNFTYQYASDKFKEMLMFLNEMYRKNIIISGNLSTTATQIRQNIQNGIPFACILSPQDFSGYFKNAALKDINYVPIVLTNSNGDAPQLRNLSSWGLRNTMVTKNCKRPDRVIKLLDFLQSEEGQALIYWGVEGTTYDVTIESSTIVEKATALNGVTKDIKYKYGQMEFTQTAWNKMQDNDAAEYGFLRGMILLYNPMYPRLTSPKGNELNYYWNYVEYNTKAALIPYTFSYKPATIQLDPLDDDYLEMVNIETDLKDLWYEYLPKIISAPTASQAENIYNQTLATARQYGYEDLLEVQNQAFQKMKIKMGITWAYPPNDPQSNYHNLTVESLRGNIEYNLEIPDNVTIQ